VIVAVVVDATGVVVTVNVAVEAFAATVTVPGTETLAEFEVSVMLVPLGPAMP